MNLLLANAADFIHGNILANGLTGTTKLAGTAEAFGINVEIHVSEPAQHHMMSAIGNRNYCEIVWVQPDLK